MQIWTGSGTRAFIWKHASSTTSLTLTLTGSATTLEFAKDQAKQARHSFDHELAVLTVHGVLHLLGYDHAEPEEEREMFGLQAAILDEWYSDRRLRDRSKRQSQRDEDLLRKTGLLFEPDGN